MFKRWRDSFPPPTRHNVEACANMLKLNGKWIYQYRGPGWKQFGGTIKEEFY